MGSTKLAKVSNWFEKFFKPTESPKIIEGVFVEDDEQPKYENIVEAIAATNSAISSVRSETRERNKWVYLMDEEKTPEEAVEFFGFPQGSLTRVGTTAFNKRMIAIWRGQEAVPTSEPDFE